MLLPFAFLQQNFDFVLCRGEVGVKIFTPWIESLTSNGLKICKNSVATDLILSKDTGCISQVVCEGDVYEADAFVLALGISSLQSIILSRCQSFCLEIINKIMHSPCSCKIESNCACIPQQYDPATL